MSEADIIGMLTTGEARRELIKVLREIRDEMKAMRATELLHQCDDDGGIGRGVSRERDALLKIATRGLLDEEQGEDKP